MQKYLVEFLGALFFVYIILATGNPLAIGAALALAILVTRDISGGHINPAVTIAMAAAGKIPTTDINPYCVSQILGALVALQIFQQYKL